jgi:curli biogenesis system outer membrane secretion channel CsgG
MILEAFYRGQMLSNTNTKAGFFRQSERESQLKNLKNEDVIKGLRSQLEAYKS